MGVDPDVAALCSYRLTDGYNDERERKWADLDEDGQSDNEQVDDIVSCSGAQLI